MACGTCDHTMQSVAAGVWWCPRCGTLKRGESNHADRPDLIVRLRDFLKVVGEESPVAEMLFYRLGVRECLGPTECADCFAARAHSLCKPSGSMS